MEGSTRMSQASRSSARILRGITVATMAAATASCSLSSPTSVPPSPVLGGQPTSAAILAATPTQAPMPIATPTPTEPPVPFDISWTKSADPATPNVGDWQTMFRPVWTRFGGKLVMAIESEGGDDGPMIWVSDDGLHWRAETVPAPSGATVGVEAVTIGGPGLVAIGEITATTDDVPSEAFWSSADGVTWSEATYPRLTDGQLWLLRTTLRRKAWWNEAGVDVTTYGGPPWTGEDPQAVVAAGGRLTALVGDTPAMETGQPVGVWQADEASGWSKVGTLPASDGAIVRLAADGPSGWIAEGCDAECLQPLTWTSANGVTWVRVSGPVAGGPPLVADQAGYVATGYRVTSTGGCVRADGDIFGETWTSSTGRIWRQMPDQPSFNRASIEVLIPQGRTLVGLGVTWSDANAAGSTAWTVDLPAATSDAGVVPAPTPGPTPAPTATSDGCG